MNTRRTTVSLLAALALGGALLAGCSSEGASTNCGLDQCTVTFDRGVQGNASILGVEAKFVQADDNTVTLEVAGEQISLSTGGQAVDGPLSVEQISRQVAAEGARQVVVVSDEPDKYPLPAGFAPGTAGHHRAGAGRAQLRVSASL